MATKERPKITEEKLQGFKYFKILGPLLESLHQVGTQRDKAQNRQLHFDQHGALLLLYFFQQALKNLTAVDGSLLPALSKMAWALWGDDEHRAAKMHLAFEVLRGIPVKVTITEGNGNEKHELRGMLESDRLYVIDRGYAEYQLLATDRMDLDAELVALGYRFRWSVELFFRWLKCILGCRHLLSHSQNGVTIQVYLAIIASLLISLWTGRKPTK